MKQMLTYAYNVLLDHSQEYAMYSRPDALKGIKDLLVRGRILAMRAMLEKEKKEGVNTTEEGQQMTTLYYWVEREPRSTWNSVNGLQFSDKGFNAKQKIWYEKLVAGDYKDRLLDLTFLDNRHELLLELVKDIFKNVFDYSEEDLKKSEEQGEGEGENGDGDGEASPTEGKELSENAKKEVERWVDAHEHLREDYIKEMPKGLSNKGDDWIYIPGATKVIEL